MTDALNTPAHPDAPERLKPARKPGQEHGLNDSANCSGVRRGDGRSI